jgi:integrase
MFAGFFVFQYFSTPPFRISFRHTFRQLLGEAGIEDFGVIKRMMGQSRRGEVDEVYYSVTENGLMRAKEKFQEYLTKNII